MPDKQVLGEALMSFSEFASLSADVSVLAQTKLDRKLYAKNYSRGAKVKFHDFKSFTTSNDRISLRIIESLIFGLWISFS